MPVLNTGHVRAVLGDGVSAERVRWEEDRIIANEMGHAAFDRAYPDFGEADYDFPAFGALDEVTPAMVYELASDAVSVQISRTPIADTFGSDEPNYALTREVVRSVLLDSGFSSEEFDRLEGLRNRRSRTNVLLLLARGRGDVDELRDTVRTRLMEQAKLYLGHIP